MSTLVLKTCNLCKDGDDKCANKSWMNRPYTHRKYKMHKYGSKCEYYKAAGWCGKRCQKTCTGEGVDRKGVMQQPYEGYAFK